MSFASVNAGFKWVALFLRSQLSGKFAKFSPLPPLPRGSEAQGFEVVEHGAFGVAPDNLIGRRNDFRQGIGHGEGPASGLKHFQVVQVIAEHHTLL